MQVKRTEDGLILFLHFYSLIPNESRVLLVKEGMGMKGGRGRRVESFVHKFVLIKISAGSELFTLESTSDSLRISSERRRRRRTLSEQNLREIIIILSRFPFSLLSLLPRSISCAVLQAYTSHFFFPLMGRGGKTEKRGRKGKRKR